MTLSPPPAAALPRMLSLVVFALMLAAILYAAWIGIANFSRIHV